MFTLIYGLALVAMAGCLLPILMADGAEAAPSAHAVRPNPNDVILVDDPIPSGVTPDAPCKRGDKEACLAAAQNGDTDAQYAFWEMYSTKDSNQKEREEATKWLLEAANHGNRAARAKVGVINGAFAMKHRDYAEAMNGFKLAAENGDALAQTAIGDLYESGKGVKADYAEAMKWYRMAADQGYAIAQFTVGRMCDDGEGVQQDYGVALQWYRLAADQGLEAAQAKIGRMNLLGQGTRRNYDAAMQWFRMAAEKGFAPAQNLIGTMYDNGQGVKQDYAEAMKWYRLAAEQGDADAQYNMGVLYNLSHGVAYDYAKAIDLYRRAAKKGNADAKIALERAAEPQYLQRSFARAKSDKDRQCFTNESCLANRFWSEASRACTERVQAMATHDFSWTEGWFGEKFTRYRVVDLMGGVVQYVGNEIKMQNGLGLWVRVQYICTYDISNKEVVSVDAN